MERFAPLLLEVWRQACRNIRIDASVQEIAPVVARRLPFDRLLLRQLDPAAGRLQTLAHVGPNSGPAPGPQQVLKPQGAARLAAWAVGGCVLRGTGGRVAEHLPGLLPAGFAESVLAVGLAFEGQPLGALILGAAGADVFSDGHERLLAALREPLSVAIRNDGILRELSTLREAAEADRASLLARLGRRDIVDTVVGAQSGLQEVMRRVDLVAPADTPVLIRGETGSGKEVVARAVHRRSRRASGPFLRVNCGAIPPELADSELFGHERGSFTGASAQRLGWFERADRGTLFLDEIGELSPAVQVRLLRILQDGTFQRVGGQRELSVDVRVVAATHRDLGAMVAAGQFRADLWYRINTFPIALPALRERPGDIPELAVHFALRAATRLGLPACLPAATDIERLVAYPWPGNVRELAAVIERAAILGNGGALDIATALGTAVPSPSVSSPTVSSRPPGEPEATMIDTKDQNLGDMVRRHIEATLRHCQGRIEGPFGAAQRLGVNPHTLRSRMRRLGIDWRRFRPAAH
jgi:hydrogenase-4 transcriptional activator